MKKILPIALSALLLMTGCSGGGKTATEDPIEKYGSDKLKLFTWGEYLGENVISNFEK